MSWRWTNLPYRLREDPGELRHYFLALLDESKGNLTTAAEALGIARRMFYMYIKRLDLIPKLDGIRDKYASKRKHRRGTQNEFEELMARDEGQAREVLLWTLQDAKGDHYETARGLGVRTGRLSQYLKRYGLVEEAAALRDARIKAIRISFPGTGPSDGAAAR